MAGIAHNRGEDWAESVARKVDAATRAKPWPATEKMLAIARTKIDDLSRNPEALDRLARRCAEAAAKRWPTALERRQVGYFARDAGKR